MTDCVIKLMLAVNMRKAVIAKWLAWYNEMQLKKDKEEIIHGAFEHH